MKAYLLLFFAVGGVLMAQVEGDRILGTWNTPNGESKIEIVKCGDAYCGSIKSMNKPMNDEHNPDAGLRNRSLVGIQILKGFKYSGPNTCSDGTLYGPERGKEVTPKIVLTNADSLDIKVTAGVARKTVTWTRVK
jgi:uncharacterized protein (DUF2147 family)